MQANKSPKMVGSVHFYEERLRRIFPKTLTNHNVLTNQMAARLCLMAVYGNCVEGTSNYFSPTMLCRFGEHQSTLLDEDQRSSWIQSWNKSSGEGWYAENTRETVRKNILREWGVMGMADNFRRELPSNSRLPRYLLREGFFELLDPSLGDDELNEKVEVWKEKNLSSDVLKRSRLLNSFVGVDGSLVNISLPTVGGSISIHDSESSRLTKAYCDQVVPHIFSKPIVIHVSTAEGTVLPEFVKTLAAYGIDFSAGKKVPDVIIVEGDKSEDPKINFVEIVSSSGPIDDIRSVELYELALIAGHSKDSVCLTTVFSDRNSSACRRLRGHVSNRSKVWFASEPNHLHGCSTIF